MKNIYRWLAGWMAALCLLTALAAPVSAEGFDYTWDQDTENNPGGPHCKAYLMLNLDTDTVVYSDNRRRTAAHGVPDQDHDLYCGL